MGKEPRVEMEKGLNQKTCDSVKNSNADYSLFFFSVKDSACVASPSEESTSMPGMNFGIFCFSNPQGRGSAAVVVHSNLPCTHTHYKAGWTYKGCTCVCVCVRGICFDLHAVTQAEPSAHTHLQRANVAVWAELLQTENFPAGLCVAYGTTTQSLDGDRGRWDYMCVCVCGVFKINRRSRGWFCVCGPCGCIRFCLD